MKDAEERYRNASRRRLFDIIDGLEYDLRIARETAIEHAIEGGVCRECWGPHGEHYPGCIICEMEESL